MAHLDDAKYKFPALRVNQLDADEIDDELCDIVLNQYKKILELLSVSDLSKYDAEAKGLFRILFWWWSVKKFDCTLGQQMMDMSYNSFGSSQKLVHLCLTIIAPYLRERLPNGIRVFFGESTCDYFERNVFKRMDVLLEFLNVCHFLIFLNRGGFRNLTERFLGLNAVHNNQPVLGEIDYSVINRELLWHGFADVLIFVLPLLKFRRLLNFFKLKFFTKRKRPRLNAVMTGLEEQEDIEEEDNFESSMILSKDFVSKCAVCREYPIVPCHFGCGHAFCYYCLRANLDDDDKFICPDCSCSAKNRKLKFVGAKRRL